MALAGLVILGQALVRSVQSGGDDIPTLRALGFSRRQVASALALPHVLSAGVAVGVAVVTAVALSPLFPIGLGRRVEPDPGAHVDLPVLAGGAAMVLAALAVGGGLAAWRAASPGRMRVGSSPRSAVVSALMRAGAPATMAIGAGLALEPGRGQRSLPTRPALVGACVGVVGVIGAMTLAAGIGDATGHPERFGSVWDVQVQPAEAPDDALRATVDRLAGDPDVTGLARVARSTLPVGDVVAPFYSIDDLKGSIRFVLLDGRPPEHPGEVVLGPDSASTFGVGVGDQLEIGAGGQFTVVGLGLLPTTPHSSFDQGGWLLADDAISATPEELLPPEAADADGAELREVLFEYGMVAARFADGTDIAAATARIGEEAGDTVIVDPASEPLDQRNLRNVRSLPLLFAVFMLALAVGALAHVCSSVLRRRRSDLAVLRSLGFTPRQVRACLAWQATTLAVIGLVVGVPLGIALGRVVWRLVTDATPMVYVEPVAVVALALVVPVALLLANALAAVPGHRAARLKPSEVLHTE